MKSLLKQLTTDSAVYGVSSILGRFITFLLVPFYSHTLPKAEYGVVIVVYAYIAFLNGVFTFGLEPAYMRFVAGDDGPARPDRRNRVFTSSTVFILAAGLALSAVVMLLRDDALSFMGVASQWSAILPLALGLVVVDAVNSIPFAALRMERRARMFASIKLVSIVLNVGLNVLFIAVLGWSIVSIFLSGLLASLSSTLLLLPQFLTHLGGGRERGLLKELLRYGFPTMPGAIAIMLIEIIDKPIMQLLTDAATVGLYGVNYKLGIFMMLVVTMFRYAWQPFYLQLGESDEARRLFARVLTYFSLLAALTVLLLSFTIDEIVRIPLPLRGGRTLIAQEYWSGVVIVPVVLLGYLFAGTAQILNAGLYLRKRTMIVLYATVAAAALNVIACFTLIPRIGMLGGAFATLASYVLMSIVYWAAGRRILPIDWEYARLLRIAVAMTLPAVLWYLVPSPSFPMELLWEAGLLALFLALLAVTGFFTARERDELRGLLRRVSR
ncbi:MAG TPA: polysaccharide biosynthesis C-terminal domain-containing protein [Bacteroidota bacterium]|nr:polysaccharide biosynthesis C-terminal domain-containing protein [Bacteroidota bacterium]